MNPDKLFDYLDGKLPEFERTELEKRLMEDPNLQRQLAIARQIHRGMGDSREVILRDETPGNRGAILGRRVAVAFALLVFLNVFVGIAFIIGLNRKPAGADAREARIRRELMEPMQKAADSVLPAPTFDVGEIKLAATPRQREAMAKKVLAAARQSGGSAAKNLNDESGLLIFAEVPGERANEFREALKKLGAIVPETSSETATNDKAILQIRIVENAKP